MELAAVKKCLYQQYNACLRRAITSLKMIFNVSSWDVVRSQIINFININQTFNYTFILSISPISNENCRRYVFINLINWQ